MSILPAVVAVLVMAVLLLLGCVIVGIANWPDDGGGA